MGSTDTPLGEVIERLRAQYERRVADRRVVGALGIPIAELELILAALQAGKEAYEIAKLMVCMGHASGAIPDNQTCLHHGRACRTARIMVKALAAYRKE